MKLTACIAAAFLAGAVALAQEGDRELLRKADFCASVLKEAPATGANFVEKAMWEARRQMTGRDIYEPANYMFLRQASRDLGVIPAFFALSDRILRDTRLGTVRAVPDPADGLIHEGPEAYSLKRKDGLRPLARDPATSVLAISAAATHGSGLRPSNAGPLAQSPASRPSLRWVSGEYAFTDYLIDNDLKQDARSLLFADGFHPSDTLTYLRGWTLYQLKELEQARSYLQNVPRGSSFYDKAFFYSNAISAHLGDYETPAAKLKEYSGPYVELKEMQLAGLALLRDDPEAFKSAAESFRYQDHALQSAEHELDDIYTSRYQTRQKSPWLAAAASALVPGLGKVYAGQLGEGISTFLITGALGAITAEHWVKDGPKDWKTIVPAVLTGILYIGNIYGSYMSVSIYNTRVGDAQQTAVLYNIHIPLRTVFK